MPLIDIIYAATVDEKLLHRLGELLPDVVPKRSTVPKNPGPGRRNQVT